MNLTIEKLINVKIAQINDINGLFVPDQTYLYHVWPETRNMFIEVCSSDSIPLFQQITGFISHGTVRNSPSTYYRTSVLVDIPELIHTVEFQHIALSGFEKIYQIDINNTATVGAYYHEDQ